MKPLLALCYALHWSVYMKISHKRYSILFLNTNAQSARVSVSLDGDDSDENDIVKKLYLRCEECGSITEVAFAQFDADNPKYIKGKIIE